jgi:acetyltransferase-like isoleucine patch superfamily enzyme
MYEERTMERETFQKMIHGAWYFPMELADLRLKAQRACHAYNQLDPGDMVARTQALEALLGEMGKDVVIEQPFHCDYGCNLFIGEGSFFNYQCVVLDCAPVRLGKHVLCGPGCSFLTAIHPTEPEARLTNVERAAPITIGDNVWLGGNVTVLPGVTIGAHTVVGAGSVVTRDLPDRVIAVGNPARVIKTLS